MKTQQEIRAIAFNIADEIETRADAIQRQHPHLTYAQCQLSALQEMAA